MTLRQENSEQKKARLATLILFELQRIYRLGHKNIIYTSETRSRAVRPMQLWKVFNAIVPSAPNSVECSEFMLNKYVRTIRNLRRRQVEITLPLIEKIVSEYYYVNWKDNEQGVMQVWNNYQAWLRDDVAQAQFRADMSKVKRF